MLKYNTQSDSLKKRNMENEKWNGKQKITISHAKPTNKMNIESAKLRFELANIA